MSLKIGTANNKRQTKVMVPKKIGIANNKRRTEVIVPKKKNRQC